MDLRLDRKRVVFIGPDDDLTRACSSLLVTEGALVASPEDGEGVDIVVARPVNHSSVTLVDCDSPETLQGAWDGVVQAVAAYRQALPHMTRQQWGRLIWVGTSAAKSLDAADDDLGAIVSLAMMAVHKVIGAEAGPAQVTANTVLRGGQATDADVATAVAFLSSEGAGYLTGVTINIDGGIGSAVF
jgi:hypothetical protein